MPYSVSLPDGTIISDIPDDMPQAEARRQILLSYPQFAPKPDETKSGFVPALQAGFKGLKSDAAALAAKTGLMDVGAAEEYIAKQREESAKIFQPTEDEWSQSPWKKLKELAGGSAAYMAAPVIAGAATLALPATIAPAVATGIGMGLTGLVSGAQFTGSNLTRQMGEGASLADTELGSAALAAIPQAALDVLSFKMIPGVRGIFGAAGKKMTAEEAEAIATQGLKRTVADYTLATGKTMGVEGLTEAGQQVFERLQAGLSLTDEKAQKEYLDSFLGGAALGGAMAPVGRYFERGREQREAEVVGAMPGQRPGESLADAAKRLQAEIKTEKELLTPALPVEMPVALRPENIISTITEAPIDPVVAPFIEPMKALESTETPLLTGPTPEEFSILSEADLAAKINAPNGYGEIEQYKQQLKTLPRTAEVRNAIAQAEAIQAESNATLVGDLTGDKIARQGTSGDAALNLLPADLSTVITPELANTMGLVQNRFKNNVFNQIVGKDMAVPEDISAVRTVLENHIASIKPGDTTSKIATFLRSIPPATETVNVGTTDTAPGGESTVLASEPGAGTAPAGVDTTQPSGVVPLGQDVTGIVGGEAAAPPSVGIPPVKESKRTGVEESVQDKSRREWQENFDRVVNAPDLNDVSTRDIERAINYASTRSSSESRRGWDGSPVNTALIQSLNQEVENFKFALKNRQVKESKRTPEVVAPPELSEVEKQDLAAAEAYKAEAPARIAEKTEQFKGVLSKMLSRMGLKDVAVKIMDDVESKTAEGSYSAKLIKIALDAQNPVRVLNHEVIHALKELGFFTDSQWKVLTKQANESWVDTYLKNRGIDGNPLQQGEQSRYDAYMERDEFKSDPEAIVEEAIADAFGDFDVNGAPSGMLKAILNRLISFFDAIKSALQGNGLYTSEQAARQVFGKIARGELTPGKAQAGEEKLSLGVPKPLADRGITQEHIDLFKDMRAKRDRVEEDTEFATRSEKIAATRAFNKFFNKIAPLGEQKITLNHIGNFVNLQKLPPDVIVPPADAEEVNLAKEYAKENGIAPYVNEGLHDLPLDTSKDKTKFSIKTVDKFGFDPVNNIPLNKNGTVTLYYHTTKAKALAINKSKVIKSDGKPRIYLTNESNGGAVLTDRGNMDQDLDGSAVLVNVNPDLVQKDVDYETGRVDFFIPLTEGEFFAKKMQMASIQASRKKALTTNFSFGALEDRITNALTDYYKLSPQDKRVKLNEAKAVLKSQHNIGTLLSENGKLQKTRIGDYGLKYEGNSVASMGLGLAAAQKISEKISTCPNSAICEGLCLGETSGGNLLYGGAAEADVGGIEKSAFRAGPRMAQYLKTEAMIIHPEEFAILLDHEINLLEKWAAKPTETKKNPETGKRETIEKEIYTPAIRLNVTSDFKPSIWTALIEGHPDTEFYDYTKLNGNSIAQNHHLTYSSTGVSQVVNGEEIVNEHSNWASMKGRLDRGFNVAMAFTTRNVMPKALFDEESGKTYEVWDGDNYDARFLDPKSDTGQGMIVGLTNKDFNSNRTEALEKGAAKKTDGFFVDYDPKQGDTVTILDQSKFKQAIVQRKAEKRAEKEAPVAMPTSRKEKLSLRAPETKEFKQWFGDSKVVNSNGEPLVVYHYSPKSNGLFNEFDKKRITSNDQDAPYNGFWFSGKPEEDMPRGTVRAFYIALKNPASAEQGYRVARKIENNYDLNPKYKAANSLQDAVRIELASQGFDGIIHYTPEESSGSGGTWIAFEPNQIKSATENIGTYDRESPDIRYSLRTAFGEAATIGPKMDGKFLERIKNIRSQIGEAYTSGEITFDEYRERYDKTNEDYVAALRLQQKLDESSAATSLEEVFPGFTYIPIGTKVLAVAGRYTEPTRATVVGSIDVRVGERAYKSPVVDFGDGKHRKIGLNDIKEVFLPRPTKFSLRTNLNPAISAAIDRTVTHRIEEGWAAGILKSLSPKNFSEYRQVWLNRYNQLGVYDKMRADRMGGFGLLADASSEAAAMMSDYGAGLTAAVFAKNGGVPVYANGMTTISNLNGSIKAPLEIFAPLLKLGNGDPYIYSMYQFWAGVKRGTHIMKSATNPAGTEVNFTPADIAKAADLERQYPEFVTIQKDWIKYNNQLSKYLVDTGVISGKARADWIKYADYIPFYRQMDDEQTLGPKLFQSLTGVKPPKTRKGESTVQLSDFLETIIRNTQSAIQMGIKNTAGQKAVTVALSLNNVGKTDVLEPLNYVSTGLDSITILVNGQKKSFRSNDRLWLQAVTSLNLPDVPFMGLFSKPAQLLRTLVTKEPGFMLANMIRDSMSAHVTSGVNGVNPASTLINFAAAIAGKSPEFQALFNAGILGGHEYSKDIIQSGSKFASDLRKTSGYRTATEKMFSPVTGLWDALETGTTASDAATRMQVYKEVLAQTGNETEAIYRAVEVMNFNRKGNSAIVRVLTAAIPFLNARIQGLDVFYRAAFGKGTNQRNADAIQKQFFIRGATMMAISCMYWALTHDDDDYKKQEQETKDNYWLLPSLGIKLPIPFEVGVLFKVIPERIMAVTFGKDTNKDFTESMTRQLVNTFAFNPIPQVFKPIVEYTTNYNFFTGRPIVGQGMEGVESGYQTGPNTSAIAADIGKATGLSPMKVDQLVGGFTGTMGMYAFSLMDSIYKLNSDSTDASKRFEQSPVIKRFLLDPEARGTVTAYYETKNATDAVVRTAGLLERTMNYKEWAPYYKENIKMIATNDYLLDLEKSMKNFREMKMIIRASKMSPDEKRDALLNVTKAENKLTSNIQVIKKNID